MPFRGKANLFGSTIFAEAWRLVIGLTHKPAALILSRQAMPTLDRKKYAPAEGLRKGAYILADAEKTKPKVILMGTGSEVSLCLQVYEQLKAEGIPARVVSMPSWELFESQDPSYRDQVLPPDIQARVAVEQASSLGWERYTGIHGALITMKTFGASAPLKELQSHFGFTPGKVLAAAKEQIKKAG